MATYTINKIQLPNGDICNIGTNTVVTDAMIFKGTLGSSGATISELPASHETGWTYKVITAGTYAGKACEVGDLIICINTSTTQSNDDWTVAQTNIDGAVTGPASSTNSHVAVFDGTTGKIIKDGGYSIASWAQAAQKPTYTATEVGAMPSTIKMTYADITKEDNDIPEGSSQEAKVISIYDKNVKLIGLMQGTAYQDGQTSLGLYVGNYFNNVTTLKGLVIYQDKIGNITYSVAFPENFKSAIGAKSTQTSVPDPTASGTSITFIDTISQNSQGVITPTKKTIASASQSAAGLMSSNDKTKLDGIATGAQVNSITGVKGNSESSYRIGNVNLTPANIGAVNITGDTITGDLKFATNWDTTTSPSNDTSFNTFQYIDKNGYNIGSIRQSYLANGRLVTRLLARRLINNTNYLNEISAWIGADGTKGYAITEPNIFRTAISAASSDHTHTTTVAADSGTNQLTLAAATKYKLTAGGTTFVFTTPDTLTQKYSSVTKGTNPASTFYYLRNYACDKNGTAASNRLGGTEGFLYDNGATKMVMRAYKNTSGSEVYNQIGVTIKQDGTCLYDITAPAAFRNAIGTKYAVYNSVTDLGLTTGSATIIAAFNAMSEYTMLICQADDFASGEVPSNQGVVEIVKTSSEQRSYAKFHGKAQFVGDYSMYEGTTTYNGSNGNKLSGYWQPDQAFGGRASNGDGSVGTVLKINVPNSSSHLLAVGADSATRQYVGLIFVNGSGSVQVTDIFKGSNVTISTNTRAVTLTFNASCANSFVCIPLRGGKFTGSTVT